MEAEDQQFLIISFLVHIKEEIDNRLGPDLKDIFAKQMRESMAVSGMFANKHGQVVPRI